MAANKNIRIPIEKKRQGPPLPPALSHIWEDKGGKFKNYPRDPKFYMGF
jgi:hypothetical protein